MHDFFVRLALTGIAVLIISVLTILPVLEESDTKNNTAFKWILATLIASVIVSSVGVIGMIWTY